MAASPDVIDVDASLASMNITNIDNSAGDTVPLDLSYCETQKDLEATSSDSSSGPRKTSLSRSRAKKVRKAAHETQASKPLLRPAKDVLSRIRHDPALQEADYIVGYHDRHADVMEMSVSDWKGGGDVTDEEWIPQHRILYFRQKSDPERKVWDRATRLDRLFGSGVVTEDHEFVGIINHRATEAQKSQSPDQMVVTATKNTPGSHEDRTPDDV